MSKRESRSSKVSEQTVTSTSWSDTAAVGSTFTVVSNSSAARASRTLSRALEFGSMGIGLAKVGLKWLTSTVTPVGWLCLGLVLLWIPIGLNLSWPEFSLAGFVATILVLLAVPFLFGGKNYAVAFNLPEDRVVAGTDVVASISVVNNSTHIELPGRMDIPIGTNYTDLAIPLMRPGGKFETEVGIPAQKRGVIDIGPITTVRTDPVGVLRKELEWAEVRTLYVHPKTVSVPNTSAGIIRDLEGNPTANLVNSDVSFHAIREYAPGDGQRHIHWKSTAKTGKLMVRQFEESRRSRMALIIGMRNDEFADQDEFELAVSALGSIGIRAIRDSRDLSAVSSNEISTVAKGAVRSIRTFNVQSRNKLLDDLCLINPSEHSMSLDAVCRLTTQAINDMSLAIIFVGSKTTPRELQRMRLQLPSDIGVLAVICDPNAEPSFKSLVGLQVMTIAILDDLRGLMARFSK